MGAHASHPMAGTVVIAASKSHEACVSFGHRLVQSGFVASATIIPKATSIRGTDKGTEEFEEHIVLMETDSAAVPNVVEFLKSNPLYEITKIVAVPISGGSWDYLNWMSEVTSPKKNQR